MNDPQQFGRQRGLGSWAQGARPWCSPWFAASALWFAVDQVSKALVDELLPRQASIPLAPFLNLVHTLNPGAAFSFLADQSGWQRWGLTLVAVVASIVLAVLIRRRPPRIEAAGYALILAGALGNAVDRVARGAVVDWLDLYWRDLHWPAFNLADVGITVGAAVIIGSSLRARPRTSVDTST